MVLLLFGGGIGDEEDVTDADEGGCGGGWVVFVVIVVDAVGRTIRGAEGGEIDDGGGGCGCTAAMLPLWNVTIVEILCGTVRLGSICDAQFGGKFSATPSR